jgi:1,4-dihydroxy-2-naphthoate octaprenyltransferase
MNRLQGFIDFVRLGRPLFLAGGFIFHTLGVAIALYEGAALNLPALIWGQVAITAIQLMTHYSNDYFDLAADRANPTPTRWAGGSRVLAEGLLPPRVALAAAVVLAAVALLTTLYLGLVVQAAAWTIPLLLLALFLAWEYSGPPLRLHSRGLGEATVAIVVPVLTTLVGYTLQMGRPAWLPLLATLPLACLQAAMILVINIVDAAGDQQVRKRTLVIRLGAEQAVRLYLGLLLTAYGLLPVLVLAGLPLLAAAAVLLPLPLALWQAWRMARGKWRNVSLWDSLAFWSIGLLMGTALLETAAFLWLAFIAP